MRRILGAITATLLALTSIGAAVAQDTGSAIVTITSEGVLSAQIGDANFGTTPYNFEDQTVNANIIVDVVDGRGTGAGWNVTLSGTDFVRDENTSFPAGQLTLSNGTVVSNAGAGTDGITAPGVTLSADPGDTIATAAAGAGMGDYTITYPGALIIPGGTLVGEYQSTLTVNLGTAP